MKLVSFHLKSRSKSAVRIGALSSQGQIVDLALAYRAMKMFADSMDEKFLDQLIGVLLPSDMEDFIRGGDMALEAAREALAFAETEPTAGDEQYCYDESEVILLAPIPRPPFLRDVLNFRDHFYVPGHPESERMYKIWQQQILYYKGAITTVIGPDTELAWLDYSKVRDCETEYGLVIGKPCREVAPEDVEKYIFGYTNFCDFSARDQGELDRAGGLGYGKSKDFATGIGPYLVTKDEVDVYNMPMRLYLNGELVVDKSSSTQDKHWDEVISYLSIRETLLPGEIIGSGTVAGGSALEGVYPFLKNGDVVEEEVGPCGRLRFKITANEET